MIKKDARYHAFKILLDFERSKKQLKLVRNQYYDSYSVSENDKIRSFILSNEVVQWQRRLDYWISKNLIKDTKYLNIEALIILRLGYYEILLDEKVPIYAGVNSWVELSKYVLNRKFVSLINALLRKTVNIDPRKRDAKQSNGSWYSFPDWLINGWIKKYGKIMTENLCDWFNSPQSTDLRIFNGSKNLIKFLSELNIKYKPSPKSNNFIRIQSDLNKIISSKYFKSGNINIQGRASGAVV